MEHLAVGFVESVLCRIAPIALGMANKGHDARVIVEQLVRNVVFDRDGLAGAGPNENKTEPHFDWKCLDANFSGDGRLRSVGKRGDEALHWTDRKSSHDIHR